MGKHGKPETVRFNGRSYRRYPSSPDRSLRVYYSAAGGRHLHRAIWEFHNGAIPKGCHIHHKDGNPLNNAIANLECLSAAEHTRGHHVGVVTPAKLAHLGKIRPLASKWHGSAEGRKWHSGHSKEIARNIKPAEYACEFCGKKFWSKKRGRVRFCHLNCKASARRQSGVDDEKRKCPVCGTEFTISKYAVTKTCSHECGCVLRRQRRAAS